jgi:hypothetical protein
VRQQFLLLLRRGRGRGRLRQKVVRRGGRRRRPRLARGVVFTFVPRRLVQVVDGHEQAIVHDAEALEDPAVAPQGGYERVVSLGLEQYALGKNLHKVEILVRGGLFGPLRLARLKSEAKINKQLFLP